MVNAQTLQGNWNEIKGKIKQRWGQLTDDELQSFSGDADQLIGVIQRKTGEARSSIEGYLDELGGGVSSVAESVRNSAGRLASSAREYTHRAAESFSGASQHMMEGMRDRYSDAERMVRDNPTSSLAVVFGAGLVLGILAGLMLRSR